ncbi:LacI family DNA-binding transcriptional regulator [Rhizobium sp. TRM95111]|uniref:LacI family DNA-binding transcriptional regulator n=1 Tax=Rhizobium alarense TaxID=2846851 RepID=UPI001F1B3287|nr:LacI family DNA-binding transcriptional regulator [Rhizobium alarense]MCF3638879.1 LacI family DNA-binding transcriptional regulator [Rhizobium alarense]
MSSRPTITDLAKAAGVSVATVDRVLNGRHRVREETARRVYDAATTIGYHAVGLLRQRVFEDLPQYRLGFSFQRPNQFFYQSFAREIEAACHAVTTARVMAQVEFIAAQTPAAMTDMLKHLAARNQALAVVAPDYPATTNTVSELRQRGIPVFCLLSDFAMGVSQGYIGLNNLKVGRTAAWMIAKGAKKPGKVAIFVGSHRFHGHELREIGFRSFFRENGPEFEVLDTLVNLDTSEITHEATANLLNQHPDLIGLYVAGGGMEGAISAIREEGYAGKLQVIVNELTPESRAGLADDVVTMAISTPLPALCRELVSLMIATIESAATGPSGQTFLPFDIYTPENI